MREWLRQIRLLKGLTEMQVAIASNIAQPFYHNIENGTKCPSVKTAKTIAAVLGFDWTLFFADIKPDVIRDAM